MRNRIFGAIGVVWGGAMIWRAFFGSGLQGSGAYRQGQNAALVFAILLFLVGGYYLVKGGSKKP